SRAPQNLAKMPFCGSIPRAAPFQATISDVDNKLRCWVFGYFRDTVADQSHSLLLTQRGLAVARSWYAQDRQKNEPKVRSRCRSQLNLVLGIGPSITESHLIFV